jgi:outer membrane lipoprotein-sorting protein
VRATFFGIVLSCWVVSGAPAEAQDPLDALLARMSAMPGLEARFREEKRIGLLSSPLVNEGTLHFARPGRLARRTLRPARSTLVLSDDRLVMSDGRTRRAIDLAESPTVRAFIAPFVALFSGDRAALENGYRVRVTGDAGGAWELLLTPRLPEVRRALSSVRVVGHGATLERLIVTEQNGDVSDTTFHDVRPRRYSPGELARIFRLI